MFKRMVLFALALMTCSSVALAENISFEGTVTASYTHEVYAASSAIVEKVAVAVGDSVSGGDMVASLRTTKVYAEEDGTVCAIFGQEGGSADTVTENYGAAIYMEGAVVYTVSSSTASAYDSVETKLVHAGETVYLRSRADEDRIGTGVITTIEGTDYQINVTEGDFLIGENVNVYRDANCADTQRIGKGTVARQSPIAVTGTGRIVSIAVQVGDEIKCGDLLMETLDGSGDTAVMNAGVSGVVAQLNVTQGSSIAENDVAAVIWPDDAMRVEAVVNESDLAYIGPGDAVSLAFDWNADSGETIYGTVQSIAAMSDADSEDTVFTAYIAFEPNDAVRYGMNVTVSVQE